MNTHIIYLRPPNGTVSSKSQHSFHCVKLHPWAFPHGPVVKISPFNTGGAGSIPSQGAKILHALWPKKKKKNIGQKHFVNKFKKDFLKKVHIKK